MNHKEETLTELRQVLSDIVEISDKVEHKRITLKQGKEDIYNIALKLEPFIMKTNNLEWLLNAHSELLWAYRIKKCIKFKLCLQYAYDDIFTTINTIH